MKIIFALPAVGQPRHAKRIAMLAAEGADCSAVAFERDYHRGRVPDCPITTLGRVDAGRYVRRLLSLVAAIPTMRKAIKRNDVIYAFGPDMALLCRLGGVGLRKPLVIEIGDIRPVQVASGPKGWLARAIDRIGLGNAKLLVSTAAGFVDGYYRERLGTKVSAFVIENKLEHELRAEIRRGHTVRIPGVIRCYNDRRIRIGYFGLLRCDWSWQVLQELVDTSGSNFELLIAGRPILTDDLISKAKRHEKIMYVGEYRSPDDLAKLYNSVDLVWACYPAPASGEANWRWARTNRFYESCAFRKPMIALEGSADGNQVQRLGLGLAVPQRPEQAVAELITKVTRERLGLWTQSVAQLPEDTYYYNNEGEVLAKRIRASLPVRDETIT